MEYKGTNTMFKNSDKAMDLYENNSHSSPNLDKDPPAASPQNKPLPTRSPLSSRFNQPPKPMHCAKSTESCSYDASDYSINRASSTVKLEASLNLDTTTDEQSSVFERMPQRLIQMDKPSQLSAPMTPVRRKLQRQTATAGQRNFTSSLLSTRGSSGGSFEQQSQERVIQSIRVNKSHPKLFQSNKVMSSAWKYVKRQLSQTELRPNARNKWCNDPTQENPRHMLGSLTYRSASQVHMCDTQPTTRDPQFQQQQIHGCVNNAGRFRSEVQLLNSSRKKRTSQSLSDNPLLNSNRSGKLADSQVTESVEDDGPFQVTGPTPESGTVDAIRSAQSVEATFNPTGQNEAYCPVGDYFLFDFLPYAPLGLGISSSKPHPTPVHLENPERETRWYFKYFLGKFHQLYCGYVNERDPFLLAVAKTDVQSYGISQYRAILWRKSGSQKLCISYNPTTSLTAKKVLNFFDIQRIEKGPKEVYNYEVQKDALTLEEQEGSVNFKFGVIYCIEGQTSDEDMYNNEHGSEEFNQFIKLLGDRINLKSWDRFKGGLDTKGNTTGIDSVYTVYEGHEIMFHVSTLLPFSTENRQQIERKRHVGNDIVNIIFVDGIEPDAQPSWMPSMMKTHFTHIFAIVTYCKKSSTYRLNVFAEESVPIFGPPLPSPPEFTNPHEFREFLLVKLINGEKAAFHSPVFAQKRERTLEMLLHVICSANMNETSSAGLARRTFSDVVTDSFNGITTGKEQMRHDAHIKFGQMLKLNTIIRGDAPTSCITSGQAKKKPWQPKHFHTPLQYEINCADVWKGNLIVSTENGTFLLKELCQPVLFIDRSVEVRQLEVTEQNEMLVIRYDKSREARVSVIPLADRDFGQQLDKTQVRKMSLEKSKGCHLFALNKSIIHPMKLAIVVHKRIFIYQWQIVTGQSLSSWNQIAQSNTPDNFQVIREIPILDPVQTICFLDGIPGGRICVGHRNQFDLIDERNREIMPLFRTESSRNQVVSAHEFWEDDEPELLLCFTRTCHFQKLTQMQTCSSVMRKLQSLSSSGSETAGSSGNSSSTPQRLFDQSFSPPTPALFPNASMDSSSTGTPDWTANSPLPTSSGSSEKCKANEFDFTWNFTPEQVVVSHSYIIAFTSTSIELRLINNGSLVHTLLAPDCRLVAYKNGFYFTSTADNLDNNCGSSGMCEYSTLRKLATCMSNVENPTFSQEEKSESDDLCKTTGGNKQSPVLPNTSTAGATLCAHSPLRTASDTSITKPYFIYRIAFHTDPVSESLHATKSDKNSSVA